MDSLGSGNTKKRSRKKQNENLEMQKRICCDTQQQSSSTKNFNLTHPFLMASMPFPTLDKWCVDSHVVLGGTACRAAIGPPIGAFDIGVSKFAYYFCIALPGIDRTPGELSCEIQKDGKVRVKGRTTTGGEIVQKFCQFYEMKMQQLCLTGHFELFFTLPGCVDPSVFYPYLRSDGIFEGIITRQVEMVL